MTPAEMPLEQRRANAAKFGKAVEKKYGLTGPQIGILRDAARKWVGYSSKPACGPPEPHDGQVNQFNVRQDSLDALKQKGYIAVEYRYSESDRAARAKNADAIKQNVWRLARKYDPDTLINATSEEEDPKGLAVWKAIWKDLETVAAILKGNEEKVTRITEAGRAVAAEFKFAIGAEEE